MDITVDKPSTVSFTNTQVAPAELIALHMYRPSSKPTICVRFNTPSTAKCLLARSAPSFVHVIIGSGTPDALHWKLTFEFGEATKELGQASTFGAAMRKKDGHVIKTELLRSTGQIKSALEVTTFPK